MATYDFCFLYDSTDLFADRDPADVFQEVFQELAPDISLLIGKHFTNVTNGLFRKRIITRQEISGIESQPNLNEGQRGRKVALLLYDRIKESDDPVQCLLKICDVLESGAVNDASLKKHGANMRSKLTGNKSLFLTVYLKASSGTTTSSSSPQHSPSTRRASIGLSMSHVLTINFSFFH